MSGAGEQVGYAERAGVASGLRFATEIVAWVATPWALVGHSLTLACLSVVLLIGLPTVFATPGDKPGAPLVRVPGVVTIALVVLEVGAAAVSAWVVWPTAAAVVVSVLAGATVVAEIPRWRRLARTPAASVGSAG